MSVATDIVFVTDGHSVAGRFATIARQHGIEAERAEACGPNASGTAVFHLCVDYAAGFIVALRAEPWPDATVLWINEEVMASPEVRINRVLAAAPRDIRDSLR